MNKTDNKNINLTTTPDNIIVETSNVVINVPTKDVSSNEAQNIVINSNNTDPSANQVQTPVQTPVQQEAQVVQPEQPVADKIENHDDTSLSWVVPKNIPKYTVDEIKQLSEKEKDEYRQKAKTPAKFGRHIEVKNCHNFYKISFWDFLPLFLGQLYSIVRLFIAYGDAKKTINFNKKLMTDIKANFIVGLVYGFFLWPIVLICLFVFFPFMVLNNSDVTYGWIALQQNGLGGMGEYFNRAVIPLFNSTNLAYTIIFLVLIGMFNTETFVYFLLLKFNKKLLFEMQKNNVRTEAKRIKEQSIVLKSLANPTTNQQVQTQ